MGLHYTILICAVIELLYLGQAFAQSNDTQDNAKLSYQAAGNATTDSDASLNGSSTDLGRGKPEKYPDITICDNAYGFDLEFDICDKAFAKLPEGDQFARYVTQKSYPLSSELKVPFYYTDLEEGSGKRNCHHRAQDCIAFGVRYDIGHRETGLLKADIVWSMQRRSRNALSPSTSP